MHQVDCNTQTNTGVQGQKNQFDILQCSSKQKSGRDMRPNPEHETYYKIGSHIPQFLLGSIFVYIYYNMIANYIGPLMLGSYKLENFNAEGLQKLFVQYSDSKSVQNQDFSQSLLVRILSFQEKFYRFFTDSSDYKDGQIKGIVMCIILHILLILLIWALIKTSYTPAGNVKSSRRWEEEIRQFQDNLHEQEYSFLQMFEQKYSMTYLKNQRNSKTIPVHERDLEILQNKGQQEFNMVFSEKNDSDNEGQDIPGEAQEDGQKDQLTEIREQTDENNFSQIKEEKKEQQINLNKNDEEQPLSVNKRKQSASKSQNIVVPSDLPQRKIDAQSIRSESEVVYDDRQEDIEFLHQGERKQNLNNDMGEPPFGQYLGIYDQEEYDRLLQQLYKMHIEQEIDKKNYRPCKKCYQVIKPIRTHHCSQCKECILKMDHHCQWVDNCIGFYNYKYFMNMLMYSTFALFFCSLTYLQCYLDACVTEDLTDWSMFKIALSFFFILTMNFFLFCFTIFHFWLIFQNKTTIEFCEKKSDSSKYDIGCFPNFKQIFGNNLLTWCIPTDPHIEGDGAYFQLKAQN